MLFATYLPRGTYEYTYLIRASLPGEYRSHPHPRLRDVLPRGVWAERRRGVYYHGFRLTLGLVYDMMWAVTDGGELLWESRP